MSDRLPTILKFCRDSKSNYPNCDVYLVSATEDEPDGASKMFGIRWTKENWFEFGGYRMSLTQVDTGVKHATVVYDHGWRIYVDEWHDMGWFAKHEYDLIFLHPEFTHL
jgi:hypothetical protein